ncbi:DUF192 domain-containing protein [bacterium]|nr:DUF192 domain-containing protein [bacterium]
MYRESLPENAGMLFIFDEPAYLRFWMKNTLIPLEMIRLDENFNIVDIQEAEPCTTPNQENCPIYTPKSKAQYVLEINQGLMKKSTLQEVVCELQK